MDPQCVLCEHNPHRRCNVNFAPKYLVNDVLKAKCEAPIRVEIIDRATGVPVGDDIQDVHLEVGPRLGSRLPAGWVPGRSGSWREADVILVLCIAEPSVKSMMRVNPTRANGGAAAASEWKIDGNVGTAAEATLVNM